MARLYPPIINGTIPAFIHGSGVITIPFELNRAVGINGIGGFQLKIRTIQTGAIKETCEVRTNIEQVISSGQVEFRLEESYEIGTYYKVQMAFIDAKENEVGYFSTVGVTKCIEQPVLSMNNCRSSNTSSVTELTTNNVNVHAQYYQGIYRNNDSTEKMYSSRFYLLDKNSQVLVDSGEILHNASQDTEETTGQELFKANIELELGEVYYVYFEVVTSSGYKAVSPRYGVVQRKGLQSTSDIGLKVELDNDEGCVVLKTYALNGAVAITGSYLISRWASDEAGQWNDIAVFDLVNNSPNQDVWRDYTVKHGVTYRYCLQEYNQYGLYSDRESPNKISDKIYIDFEDMFIYDGKQQLKVRFNPKVTSFKLNVSETKIDTIGSQFPFFFRNNKIAYREFPISGLISYLADNQQTFMTDLELFEEEQPEFYRDSTYANDTTVSLRTTSLTGRNIAAERKFRNKVLEWLNDGKPKLFRSPTEGNYIVRLMNISMTPNDVVGRMLYTFTATAYEVGIFNFANLEKYNFISTQKPNSAITYWRTISFEDKQGSSEEINLNNVTSVLFEGVPYGSQFSINDQLITVGITGRYFYENIDQPFKVSFFDEYGEYAIKGGQVTISYPGQVYSAFGYYTSLESIDMPVRQFISSSKTIEEEDSEEKIDDVVSKINKIAFVYQDPQDSNKKEIYYKEQLDGFTNLHFEKRGLYSSEQGYNEGNIIDPYGLYLYKNTDNKWAIKDLFLGEVIKEDFTLLNERQFLELQKDLYTFYIMYEDKKEAYNLLGDKNYFDLDGKYFNITGIALNPGVILTTGYTYHVLTFAQEETDTNVKQAYQAYLTAESNYKEYLNTGGKDEQLKAEYEAVIEKAWSDYVACLGESITASNNRLE